MVLLVVLSLNCYVRIELQKEGKDDWYAYPEFFMISREGFISTCLEEHMIKKFD